MTWWAFDSKKPHRRYQLSVTTDGVVVEGLEGSRLFPLSEGKVGVGKWLGRGPGVALSLDDGEAFVIGARGAHYAHESRAPVQRVNGEMAAHDFHAFMVALQSAWRTVHPAPQDYRGPSRERRTMRQYFDLHRVSRALNWVLISLALVMSFVLAANLRMNYLTFMGSFVGPFAIFLLINQALSVWGLKRPSHGLEFDDGRVRIRKGDRVLEEAARQDVNIEFDDVRAQIHLAFPSGNSFKLAPYSRKTRTPLGYFPRSWELYIAPESIPMLRAACSPSPEPFSPFAPPVISEPSAPPRVRVDTDRRAGDGSFADSATGFESPAPNDSAEFEESDRDDAAQLEEAALDELADEARARLRR